MVFVVFCMYPKGLQLILDYLYYILNGLWDGEIFQMMLVQVTMKLCSLRVFPRNLNSGDSIVMLFSFYNSAASPTTARVTARYSCVLRNN